MKKRYARFLGLGFLAGLFSAVFFSFGLFAGPERFFSDRLLPRQVVDDRIVLLAIDNRSIAELGSWPFARARFAELLDALADNSPASLAVDVMFSEPSRLGSSDDAQLEQSLSRASFPVIFPIEFESLSYQEGKVTGSTILRPLSRFNSKNLNFGHVNVSVDPDGIVRSVPLSVDGVPSFAGKAVGIEGEGVRRIAFAGPRGSVRTVSLVDALRDKNIQESLAGKYLFLGATASDLHDEVQTPHSRGFAVSGAELHAQIANMLISDLVVEGPIKTVSILWLLFVALCASLPFAVFLRVRPAFGATFFWGFVVILFVIIRAEAGVIFPFVYTLIAWFLGASISFIYRYRILDHEKRSIRATFGKYVSRDILEEMLANPEKVRLGGDEYEATVFFSDVRGFTTLSEKLSPSELVAFLNRYLTVMTDIVLGAGGVVDKYIGDAVMAFWGAPLRRPTHAIDSARASLVMIDALATFNADSLSRGELPIDIGIGLNSGKVVAGNMGSEQRFDYTVMGDTVNLASRLEGQTKTYGVHILASEAVANQLGAEFLVREVDQIKVKGKNFPVTVFEIVENAKRDDVSKILLDFEVARSAYYLGNWQKTIDMCEKILTVVDDGPTKVYKSRAEEFLVSPPDHWEGVYKLTSK